MFFEMGGDPAEKGSFTIVKRIAAECFLKWGRSCRKKQFYKSKTHRGRMFFELNRRVIFFLYKDFEKNHGFFYGGDVNENRHFIEGK